MNVSRSHTSAPQRVLAALVAVTALLALLGADAAHGRGLKLKVVDGGANPKLADAVGVRVKGARRARSVTLYVDGRPCRRDRSWPWSFGRRGKVRVRGGRHRIAVAARFRKGRQVRRRTVMVRDRRDRRARRACGRSTRASSGRSARSVSRVARGRPVSNPEEEPAPTSSPLPGVDSTNWRGDFETGDLSQWETIQRVATDKIRVVRDPTRQGNYAARFEVGPYDNIGDTDPRAELARELGEREGEDRYYRWFTYFDQSFPTAYDEDFVTFTQWRALDESEAFTSFMVWGDRIELRRDGTRWSTPLVKGVWHEFIYHVKWSPDPDEGYIELWYDGQQVLSPLHVRTMAGSPGAAVGNYVKQGLYHEEGMPTGILYHDGFAAGTSLSAVKGA